MVMGAGGMGAGGGSVAYQETIVVNIDERRWNQQVQQTERSFQQMMQRMQKMQQMQLKLTLNDQASKHMKTIQSEVSKLNQSSRTTIRVGLADQASSKLKSIQTELDKISRGATASVRGGGAVSAVESEGSSLMSRAGGLASGAAGMASSVGGAVAPELGGVAGIGAIGVAAAPAAAVAGIAVGLGEATRSAADFNHSMLVLQNNTTLTDADMGTLRQNVSNVSQEFGVSTTALTEAARNIMDLTQNTDAMNGVMKVAAEAAAATGADVGTTGTILASTLHQYKQDQGDVDTVTRNAAQAMGVLHVAAAEGNMTMQQFADSSGRAVAFGAQLGVPLEQVSAAMSALTRNGYDASESQTQVVNMLTHIVKPAKQAEDEITRLSKATGVDLVSAYSATGISTLGFTGIFQKTTEAYQDMGLTSAQATEETLKLLNAQRGGIGASLLMGKGASDYDQILKDLNNDQLTGQYVANAWAKAQKDPEVQISQLQQRMSAFGRDLGQKFIPILGGAAEALSNMGDWFADLGKRADSSGGILDTARALNVAFTSDAGALGIVQDNIEKAFGPDVANMTRPVMQALMDHMDTVHQLSAGLSDLWAQYGIGVVVMAPAQVAMNELGMAGKVAGNLWQGVWDAIPSDIQTDLVQVTDALKQRTGEWASQMLIAGSVMIGNLSDTVRNLATQAKDALVYVGTEMWNGLSNYWTTTAGPAIANKLWDVMRGALDGLKKNLGISSPSTVMADVGNNMMDGLTGALQGKMPDLQGVLGDIATKISGALGGVGDWVSSHLPGGSGNVGDWINKAIQATGVGADWAGGLNTIVMHESSGNPNAANLWDVNAQKGDPSRGLMQLTGSNRASYTPAGMDPMDPVAQIIAGINYIKSRYGSINNVPGVQSVAGGGAYKPYDQGGLLQPGLTMAVNNTGAPELVIPARKAGRGPAAMPRSGPLVSIGQIVQAAGEDSEAFAQRVSVLVGAHLDRWAGHVEEAFGSMPDGVMA